MINERTKAGKTLLELAKMLAVSNKGVVIDEGTEKELLLKEEKSVYNPKFVEKIEFETSWYSIRYHLVCLIDVDDDEFEKTLTLYLTMKRSVPLA